ncbi:MAG: YeeE/YedE family protein [Candidatus Lambdaproteobacteria bacterium]|nr:YeeE/YedE family protein [Candidatus Lambdaproteobacteria bacterium]
MDLIAPLFKMEFFGADAAMVWAFAIGFAFGTALEKAGFGGARKLTAQFYLYDMTVFKVMFTAVVTSMVLVTASAAAGLLDFGALFIPATFIWPQIVGGLLLGVGFTAGGYCPGTSVVSVASGRIDGMMYVLGFFAGLAVFPVFFDALEGFYNAGGLGVVTLFDVIALPPLLIASIVAALAVASFFGATWVEGWARVRWPHLKP